MKFVEIESQKQLVKKQFYYIVCTSLLKICHLFSVSKNNHPNHPNTLSNIMFIAMKVPTRISHLLFASAFLTSPLYAQDISDLNKEVKELEKQLKDLKGDTEADVLDAKDKLFDEEYQKKQERIAKAIKDAQEKTAFNRAKATASASPLYKRAQEMQKRHAAYAADVASGKIRPNQHLVNQWPLYGKQVADLTKLYASHNASESPAEKAKIATPLLEKLQPLGHVLKNATHGPERPLEEISEEEDKALSQLAAAYHSLPTSNEESVVKLLTPSTFYTLKNISNPIQFSAPAGTEIMLNSQLGGQFENDTIYISIIAGDDGLASTSWSSDGDGVAQCSIEYRSPRLEDRQVITPVVRQLNLIALDEIAPIVKKAARKTENKLNQAR